MIDYKDKEKSEIEFVTCDKCGKIFDPGMDALEIQEFHHINFAGGFGSVFGDGTQVNCDLCQHCLHMLLGKYCRCIDVES